MKKQTKILAIVLAVVMTVAMLPTFALAASGEPLTTATTVKGVTITSVGTANAAIASVVKGAVTLTTTVAAGTSTGVVPAGIDAADAVKIAHVEEGDTAAFTETAFGSAPAYANGALANGDWLVIGKDLDCSGTFATAELFYIIVVTVTADPTGDAPSGTINGDSTVEDAPLRVVLPANLNFAVNPLELGAGNVTGNQIKTANYAIANKTLAPVQVSFEITATGAAGVTFVSSPAGVKPDDFTATTKDIFFGALGAKDATTPPTYGGDGTDGVFAYDPPDGKDALVPFAPLSGDTTKAKGTVEFVLDAGTASAFSTAGSGKAGVASFQFYSNLNTYAAWKANDVTVVGAYTLRALRPATYDTLSAAGNLRTNGLNQIKGAVLVPPDGTAGNPYIATPGQTLVISEKFTTGTPLNINIKLSGAPDEAAITLAQLNPMFNYESGTHYDWTRAERTVLIKGSWGSAGWKTLVAAVGNTSYTISFEIVAA